MKKIITLACALLLGVTALSVNAGAASGNDGRTIYRKYSEAENVSAVHISPAMFRLIPRLPDLEVGKNHTNISPIINSLTGFYLVDSRNEAVSADMKRDVARFVKSSDFEDLLEMKEDGKIMHVYTNGKGDTITSLVVLSYKGVDCTFMCFDGEMSREELEDILQDAVDQ